MQELTDQFNLPKYTKGKSFADASSMIMDKFRERKDPESKRTMTEMLDRLRQAQEFVKEQNKTPEERQQDQMQMEQQAQIQDEQSQQQVDPQMQQQAPQEQPQQTQFAEGGLIEYMKSNKSNQYANGGFIDDKTQQDDQINQVIDGAQDAVASAFGPVGGAIRGVQKLGDSIGDAIGGDSGAAIGGIFNPTKGTLGVMTDKDASFGQKALSILPGVGGVINNGLMEKRKLEKERNEIQGNRNRSLNTFAEGGQMTNQYYLGDWLKTAGKNVGTAATKTGQFLNENKGDILRYAPTAVNAFQLARLPKAEVESLNKLDNRYKPGYVDEAALQNTARENYNMTSQALTGASGGSTSALRSNILGAGLNRNKALSSAYLKSSDINRGEDAKAQQFNLGVDRVNLQQSNSEKDINARNRAARDNEKSKLLSGIGTDIGSIGREEKFKDIIEKVSGYDQDGNLIDKKKLKAKSLSSKKVGIKKPKNPTVKHSDAIELKPITFNKPKPKKRVNKPTPKKKSNYIPKHVLKNNTTTKTNNPFLNYKYFK